MKSKALILFVLLGITATINAQQEKPPVPDNPIDSAIGYSQVGKFNDAYALIYREYLKNPDDPELNLMMGQALQSLCYDSRPYSGYSEATSDSILNFLNRALELGDDTDDAYFFIGVEYGQRMLQALFEKDLGRARNLIRTGYEKGGYPDWLIEYARNTLKTCDQNTILFVGEEAESNPLRYLQLVENFRTDVTVLPMPLLNYSWFVMAAAKGELGTGTPAPISWSDRQILGRRSYVWSPDTLTINVPAEVWNVYTGENEPGKMEWAIEPDLSTHSARFLSPQKALLIDIIETNNWKRPIFISNGCPRLYTEGLEEYLQRSGLAAKLLPVNAKESGNEINLARIKEVLLDPASYEHFHDLTAHPMPRVSSLLNNYRATLLGVVVEKIAQNQMKEARDIFDQVDKLVPASVFPLIPQFQGAETGIKNKFKDAGLEQ